MAPVFERVAHEHSAERERSPNQVSAPIASQSAARVRLLFEETPAASAPLTRARAER